MAETSYEFHFSFPKNVNFCFMNLSILSEYLHISQNTIIIAASKIPQISNPHHVLNGIKSREYDVVNTEIARVMIIMTVK